MMVKVLTGVVDAIWSARRHGAWLDIWLYSCCCLVQDPTIWVDWLILATIASLMSSLDVCIGLIEYRASYRVHGVDLGVAYR